MINGLIISLCNSSALDIVLNAVDIKYLERFTVRVTKSNLFCKNHAVAGTKTNND